jgi:ribonuclease P protein component
MLEQIWESLHTVLVINGVSGHMGSVHGWPPDGDAKFLAVDVRRAGSALPSVYRRSTQEFDSSGFPRRQRLSRSADVMLVRRKGKRLRARYLEARVLASPFLFGRIGFVVPKHKHTIVERNRLKRQLRELVRLELLPIVQGQDILVYTLPETYGQSFDVLKEDVQLIGGKLRSLKVS